MARLAFALSDQVYSTSYQFDTKILVLDNRNDCCLLRYLFLIINDTGDSTNMIQISWWQIRLSEILEVWDKLIEMQFRRCIARSYCSLVQRQKKICQKKNIKNLYIFFKKKAEFINSLVIGKFSQILGTFL